MLWARAGNAVQRFEDGVDKKRVGQWTRRVWPWTRLLRATTAHEYIVSQAQRPSNTPGLVVDVDDHYHNKPGTWPGMTGWVPGLSMSGGQLLKR